MIRRGEYPILEFDDTKEALIAPNKLMEKYEPLPTNKLIISFFGEAINTLIEEGRVVKHTEIKGENTLALYKYVDDDVMLMHGMIGCPATAGFLDELTGLGIDTVMFCGGGGVLDGSIRQGELLVVEGAIRDEGFSYHYVEPSRIIYTREDVRETVCSYLRNRGIPYLEGITWTTDAFYRETKELIQYRKEEGAKIVEMEQAGCIAISQFRGLKYGAIIYGGDDVSGDEWDSRCWRKCSGIRYSLIEICKDLVKMI